MIGPRHAIAPRKTERQYELATFGVELYCNGKLSQRGSGALVLGSPLLALRHLIELLANDSHSLGAGEIISTGTLTLAQCRSAHAKLGVRKSPAFHSKKSLFALNSRASQVLPFTQCPLYPKSGHWNSAAQCPLCTHTSSGQVPMSTLIPKADITQYERDVRFVPKADIRSC